MLETASDEAAFLMKCHFDSLTKEQIEALEGWSFTVIDGELEAVPALPPDAA